MDGSGDNKNLSSNSKKLNKFFVKLLNDKNSKNPKLTSCKRKKSKRGDKTFLNYSKSSENISIESDFSEEEEEKEEEQNDFSIIESSSEDEKEKKEYLTPKKKVNRRSVTDFMDKLQKSNSSGKKRKKFLNPTSSSSGLIKGIKKRDSNFFSSKFSPEDSLLAIPIVYSDEEEAVEKSSDQQIISKSFLSKKEELAKKDEAVVEEFDASSPEEDTINTSNVSFNTRGRPSTWINNLMDNLKEKNEDDEVRSRKPPYEAIIYKDSDKKQKYVKNGLADRLLQLRRQQKSEKVLFQHQQTLGGGSDLLDKEVQMKVISHHCEGLLHVLECKICHRGKRVHHLNDEYVTILLGQDHVTKNNLKIDSNFSMYPTWKKIFVDEHDFAILFCINNITTTRTNDKIIKEVEEACESLLEAVERKDISSSISISSTIQRIYKNRDKWNLLCEDAFGLFFILSIDQDLIELSDWLDLIEHGEGNRIYFQNLFIINRVSAKQDRRLHEMITSVWKPDGFGLRQIRNSQSADSCPLDEDGLLPPPSFFYHLVAYFGVSKHSFQGRESLNRPDASGSILTDVLYSPPTLLNILQIHQQSLERIRCSFIAKFFYFFEDEQICIFHDTDDVISVQTTTMFRLDQWRTGDVMLVRDIRVSASGERRFVADIFTRFQSITASTDLSKLQILRSDVDAVMTSLPHFDEASIKSIKVGRIVSVTGEVIEEENRNGESLNNDIQSQKCYVQIDLKLKIFLQFEKNIIHQMLLQPCYINKVNIEKHQMVASGRVLQNI